MRKQQLYALTILFFLGFQTYLSFGQAWPIILIREPLILEENEVSGNETVSYIVYSEFPINTTHLTEFEANGGLITNGPWNGINGFAGLIPGENLTVLLEQFPDLKAVRDQSITAQMNSIHNLLQTYPGVINASGYGLTGNTNASIAFLDTGIDGTHRSFNSSYGELDFTNKIIGWQDFVGSSNVPIDTHGHGTTLASITLGGGNESLELSSNEFGSSLTAGGNFSHIDLFYPNHVTPGWYRVKLATFEIPAVDSLFKTHANFTEFTVDQIMNYRMELYRNGILVNQSTQNVPEMEITYNSSNNAGLFEIYFGYQIATAKNPNYNIFMNSTFVPTNSPTPWANFTGIAPETKVVSIRILNDTAMGNVTSLLSGLDWVRSNNSLYQISATVLSVAAFNLGSPIKELIRQMINAVVDNGTMVFIAAGNAGVGSGALNDLALSEKAIVVGATNNRDQLTYYSSQGEISNSGIYKPDLVAPGGSYLLNRTLVTGAESNNIENNIDATEIIANDTTQIGGTSVAAAITAGVYSLIYEKLGGYETVGLSNETALWMKSLILMTASELNTLREDDPRTTYLESTNSPTLNRGGVDIHEGYGRINPKAIIDLLNNTFSINSSIEVTLGASNTKPAAEHVYAVQAELDQYGIYRFSLELAQNSSIDADIYLYSNRSDEFGRPILVKSATLTGFQNESFHFTNPNQTQPYYCIIKAISGEGTFNLNISKMENALPPILANQTITGNSTNNDILDTYTFLVNYSHPENFEPLHVTLHIINPEQNISMSLEDFQANFGNYSAGVWYSSTQRFYSPGEYLYYFTTQAGPDIVRYPQTGEFSLNVSAVQNTVSNFYSTDFTSLANTQKWIYEPTPVTFNLGGFNQETLAGWNWIQMSDLQEYRSSNLGIWGAMYCGITVNTTGGINTPLFDANLKPLYTYLLASGTHNLLSPIFYLNSSVYNTPTVSLGMRVNINTGDIFQIQVRGNRSTWETLAQYNGYRQDWESITLDLSNYMNSYVQIRFQGIYDLIQDPSSKGIMLDYFAIKEQNLTNAANPILSRVQTRQIFPYVIYNHPYVLSGTNNSYEFFGFQVAYSDTDGGVPEFVYLEIDGKNYSMTNIHGKWDASKSNLLIDGINGIIYACNLSLFGIQNTTFKFHAYDGYNYTTLIPGETIQMTELSPINLPLSTDLPSSNFISMGIPGPGWISVWIDNQAGWHQPNQLGQTLNEAEWYCGIGDYAGYGNNWDSRLVTRPITLNGTNEIFLNFDYRFTLDNLAGNDTFQLELSTNGGASWISLETYGGTDNNYARATVDLSKYMNQTVVFGFRLITDNIGTQQTRNSGLYLSMIRIDINRSRDYYKPTIEYVGYTSNQKVQGLVELRVVLSDNMGLDLERIQFYFEGDMVPVSLIDGVIYFTVDTKKFENGHLMEFVTIAYDLQNNRVTKKLILEIANPPDPWIMWLMYSGIGLGIAFVGVTIVRQIRIKKLMASGDYRPKPSWRDRLEENQFKRQRLVAETHAILRQYDKKWERAQPFRLFCKKCGTWFKSPEFEIYCPLCDHDSLYLAKHCPICDTWKFFEEEGVHQCKKCKIDLLKDFDAAREEILTRSVTHEIEIDDTPEVIQR
jgi:serine protease AprX